MSDSPDQPASTTATSADSSGGRDTGQSTNLDSLIARVVIDKGLATSEEVDAILESKRAVNRAEAPTSDQSLFEALVEQGVVTQGQIDRVRPEVEEQKAGRQIPGYKIISKLGKGAMATVYKARQLSLDRLVAIKVLPQKHTANPEFVQRFREEGRIAARLNHPNIVGAVEIGQSGNFHYFVMEFVEGRTVYDDIVDRGAYDEDDALNIAVQVADALQHAHERGLIHRDVKPKNIIITPAGVAKLADMGLARAVSDAEAAEAEAGKAFGTPYYISPEQIRGESNIDPRADIYSFGATLYHMVTGRVPFEGPSPSAVMHQHLKADLVPADHINERLSSGLAQIIEHAMERDREDRYANVAELLEDLNHVAEGRPPVHAKSRFELQALGQLEESGSTAAIRQQPDPAAGDWVNHTVMAIGMLGWAVAFILFITLLVQSLSD